MQVARRIDPGGLWRERKAFQAAMDTRLAKLGRDVAAWVERAAANPTLVANALPSDPAKAKEFQTWLEGQIKDGLLETVDGPMGVGEVPWTDQYVRPVYRKALIDTHGAIKGPLPEGIGGADWLQQAFNGPVAVRSLGHIYNRQYAGLKDITTSMEATLQRTLVNAMAQGKDVKTTARELQKSVGFSRARARTFATTELQHAYAEGQLDSMDALGVSTVNLAVEWLTAGDNKVCPKCQAQAGKTYSTKDARGLIPFHPNCRCAWIPGVPEMVAGALADGQKFIQEYQAEVQHKNALAEAAAKLVAIAKPKPVGKNAKGEGVYAWDSTPVPPPENPDPNGAQDRLKKILTDAVDGNGNPLTKEQMLDTNFASVGRTWENAIKGEPGDRNYELKWVKVSDIKVSQTGGDYLDANSKNMAKELAALGKAKAPNLEDVNLYQLQPVTLDANLNLTDGNHRHAAARLLGNDYVLAVVPVDGKGTGKLINASEFYDEVVTGKPKPVPKPKPIRKPKAVAAVKPAGIIGSPYDAKKVEAYVAANVDKKQYVRAFVKKELSKEELSLAKKGAKTAGEEVIDIAGLQTNNGGVYNTGIPAYAKKLAEDPTVLDMPIVVELPDGTRTLLDGDLRVNIALANGDTQIKVKLVKLGAGAADDLAAAKAAALEVKKSAAEAARDAFAKKLGVNANAALPLNDKGLMDPGTVTMAFEQLTGVEYSYRNNMAPIIYERLRQAKAKQTLEGQIAELEGLAKQLKNMPRRSLYKIGTPRGDALPGTKAPGAELKPLRVEMADKLKHVSTGKSLVENDKGELVRSRDLVLDAMDKRARAMEKQHDKLTKGPKTPPAVKPVATKEAIQHSHSEALVTTDQRFLDNHKEINKAYEFLNKIGDKNVLAEAMPEVAIVKGRAYAAHAGHIALDPLEDASTVIHEYTHHLEYKLSDEGYGKLNEFANKRRGTESLTQIYTREDLASEVGYKDEYYKAVEAVMGDNARRTTAHYAGKIYPEYNGRRSTEILTIGAELLYEDPVAFAKADPEWFDLVEGVLSGRIR